MLFFTHLLGICPYEQPHRWPSERFFELWHWVPIMPFSHHVCILMVFLIFPHVNNKATCWLLLGLADYPFLLVQQVQWSAVFFYAALILFRATRGGGVFPKIDFKKSTLECSICRPLGWNFFIFLFGIKRFPKSKFLGLRDSQFARNVMEKCFDPETPGLWDLLIAKFDYREILWSLDLSIARFVTREIWRLRDLSIAKNKKSVL
jgi:hypothetical protein